jgi:hypothetical protein
LGNCGFHYLQLFVTLRIALLLAIFSILLCLVLIFDKKVAEDQQDHVAGNVTEIIGWMSMALNMADFASPLAGLVCLQFIHITIVQPPTNSQFSVGCNPKRGNFNIAPSVVHCQTFCCRRMAHLLFTN